MDRMGARLLGLTAVFVGLMASPAPAAIPAPDADYRFNGNLKSSVNGDNVPELEMLGEGLTYDSREVGGKTDKFLKWGRSDGLKLADATTVLGQDVDSQYTIALYVKLKAIAGYRKLVDFDNLLSDRGLYQRDGYLYPYPVSGVDVPKEDPIVAGKWHLIVATRVVPAEDIEVVRGYVDGTRYYQLVDENDDQELGVDEILHFFIDDVTSETEETGGSVSRIRIWQTPLSNKRAKALGP